MRATCRRRVHPASLGRAAVQPPRFVLKQDPAADEWIGVRDARSLIAARCNLACSPPWPTNTLAHVRAHRSMQTHSEHAHMVHAAATFTSCSEHLAKLRQDLIFLFFFFFPFVPSPVQTPRRKTFLFVCWYRRRFQIHDEAVL